jgi:uncharacterized membrane protein YbhN (UPF0104 family)
MTPEPRSRRRRRIWTVAGALIGVAGLGWVFGRLDYARLREVLAGADGSFLIMVPIAITAEQLVRAWKWRQILHPLRRVPTLRLFGAIMAGYFGGLLIPLGVSPILRSWLIARLEALSFSAVLASVAVDRLIDGIVFTGIVAAVLAFSAFPDPQGNIRLGLVIAGAGSFAVFALMLVLLVRYRRDVGDEGSWIMRLAGRLPARFVERARALLRAFADGVAWPDAPWRQAGVVLASVVIKLIAAAHFLWAGLAFGVLLRPLDYLFLIVFLGFIVILTHFARIAGGFIVGAVFALGLFGVEAEPAVAMTLVVQISSIATVAAIGALALWRHGFSLADVRRAEIAGTRSG